MMIRINLLPIRKKVQQEAGRQILALFAVVLLGAAGGNIYWYMEQDSVVQGLHGGINATKARIAELDKTIGEVKNINTRKAEVEKKLAVLDELRRGRSGPVRMLDALSSSIPKKAWIHNFNEERGSVKLSGSAVSHDDVAELMRNLNGMVWTPKGIGRLVEQRREAKTSRVELLTAEVSIEEFPVTDIKPFFTNVDLKSTQQHGQASKPGEVSTVDFDISLSSNYAI
ncbi:PilN domain-containing protein [Melittangium boletus]|uniref:Pilus assembly protein PilN n=1 Tax=Melittangium boletus DSM 14713 TaxID=1294270 RepID=A0A250I896_9BACT|nr:PilN domain-containing protein [Melittangium boletus]ATB27985.1 pilus assembly protein PilN [Melittangium boletus DSM 14713]